MPNPLEILPIAFVGLAIGGIIVLWRNRVENITLFTGILPITIFISFSSFYLTGNVNILFPLLALPFVAVGVILAQGFTTYGAHTVYIIDLLGAGSGATCAVFLLPVLGAESLIIASVALGAIAFFLAARSWLAKTLSSWIAVFLILCALANYLTDMGNLIWWAPGSSWSEFLKPLLGTARMQGENDYRLYLTKWGLIDRVDVIGREPGSLGIGFWNKKSSPSKIMDSEPAELALHLDNNLATAVCHLKPPPLLPPGVGSKHLVLGVGGGWDIYSSLAEGASGITAVEINPRIVDIMSNELSEINNGLYHIADTLAMDGRTFIHFETGKYHRIKVSFTDTYQTFPGSNVCVENYLYTMESITELLEKLEPGGRLRIAKPLEVLNMPEMLRIVFTVYQCLKEKGIENPVDHMLLVGWVMEKTLENTFGFSGGELCVSMAPFTAREIEKELEVLSGPNLVLWRPDMGWVYSPNPDDCFSGLEEIILLYQGFFQAPEKEEYIAELDRNVLPTTDDKPFFYEFEKDHYTNLKILLRLLVVIFCVVGAPIIIYVIRKKPAPPGRLTLPIFYFGLLGLGYSLLHICFLQKFTIFLGGPIYSLIVIILSLLYFSAIGAYISSRTGYGVALFSIIVILACGVFFEVFLDSIFQALFSRNAITRVAYGFLLLAPVSIAMGIPFPYFLGRIKKGIGPSVSPIMYSVNSVFLVTGSTVILYAAPVVGFNVIYRCGLLFYFMAMLILVKERLIEK